MKRVKKPRAAGAAARIPEEVRKGATGYLATNSWRLFSYTKTGCGTSRHFYRLMQQPANPSHTAAMAALPGMPGGAEQRLLAARNDSTASRIRRTPRPSDAAQPMPMDLGLGPTTRAKFGRKRK